MKIEGFEGSSEENSNIFALNPSDPGTLAPCSLLAGQRGIARSSSIRRPVARQRFILRIAIMDARESFLSALQTAVGELGLELESAQLERMWRHFELLTLANRRINLTSIADPVQAAVRHYADSLAVAAWCGSTQRRPAAVLASSESMRTLDRLEFDDCTCRQSRCRSSARAWASIRTRVSMALIFISDFTRLERMIRESSAMAISRSSAEMVQPSCS